ncbi:hypothetical protein AKJ58_00625 [candidate division MSBL1 archaeon SCGC-AAA385D11]|uniref:Elp3/MiaA/NifB-like radical SAM core domain-containing protein n=1 Tax=candidate division MSBL1 archaeon SCGC-AAA385D11 TaxID=1698286 RepID=A0A133VP39_9EURY|nr:hypothetical protein AKJ58_00625 [candidate division MSBL1 archaeon SCGC-AAA385D11]
MKILLVEPEYYSKYPPLGLLKLSALHKEKGDKVEFVRGVDIGISGKFDRVYVTSLWTWGWRKVWECVRYYKRLTNAEVWLGGIYASVLPDHAKKSGADKVVQGLYPKLRKVVPDYSIVPEWDGSILFSTRGCRFNCPFCAVPKIEGDLHVVKNPIEPYIHPNHTRIILWDNDFLGSPRRDQVIEELKEIGKKVDFNQGLKASQIDNKIAGKLTELNLNGSDGSVKIRLGYDREEEGPAVKRAIENLKDVGIKGRRIMTYNLFNFDENPNEFLERVTNTLNLGVVSYPMRYQPLKGEYVLEKDSYVSPEWTREELEMVARARRVIGYGGSFPPYKGLVNKLNECESFWDCFKEFSERGG